MKPRSNFARAIGLIAAGMLLASTANAQVQQIAKGPVEAPYSLTAADGTGLKLVGLDARAVVDGPLAFTELRLTFQNPQPRIIEGHFKVTMPEGAAISRFAMKIRGSWMEGEVVEKQAARRAYEDALHRRQDPALLEQDSGNSFRARVFPIPANGRKEIIISWSHELTKAGESYRLPLMGLPKIESLSLTAMTSAQGAGGPKNSLGGTTSRYQVSKVQKKNFKPDQDWIIFGGAIPAGGDALRAGKLAVARFVVPGKDQHESIPGAAILVDTSASRAIGFEQRLDALTALVHKLSEIGVTSVQVIAYDQVAETVYTGAPKGFGAAAIKRLKTRSALGASSLSVAIDALAQVKGVGRAIFLTDGMVTAGEQDREAIKKRLASLSSQGLQRIDAIVDTTARDPLMLEALVTSNLLKPGKVIEARQPLGAQLSRLERTTMGDVSFAIDGADWVWPAKVRGLQGGDAVVVFADVAASNKLIVKASGGVSMTITPTVREAEKPLLERGWIAARIKKLENAKAFGDPDMRGALQQQIIKLSTQYRVLSPYTAMVVLETERDYYRFGIDRKALANILTVGPTGVELLQRKDIFVAQATPPPPPPPAPAVRRDFGRRTRGRTKGRVKAKKARRRAPRREQPAAEATAAAPMEMEEAKVAMDSFDDVLDGDSAPPAPAPAQTEGDAIGRFAPQKAVTGGAPPRAPMVKRRPRPQPNPFPGNTRRPPPPPRRPVQIAKPTGESQGRRELRDIEKGRAALSGVMAKIDKNLARGRTKGALKAAWKWRMKDPADLLAVIALGRSLAMSGNGLDASRAFGSIMDLYPSRADMRRMAGNWLAQLGQPGLMLAADTYRVAMTQRPDHPSVYHQLGMTLVRLGRYEEALEVVLGGIGARRVNGRFEGSERILQEDAQLIAAAWAAAEPKRRDEIQKILDAHGLKIDDRSSMRFVLTWETDANDVDFHIFDGKFNHAYYSRRALASGGELYADVTTGYGPECFTIWDPRAFPYKLKAHYYRRGPMGYGAGAVQVIRHDGEGHLGFEDRPFTIMSDGAYVDLGVVKGKTARPGKKVPQAIAK